jgi:hypothetical protein
MGTDNDPYRRNRQDRRFRMTAPIEMLMDKEAVWTVEKNGPPEDWDGVMPYAVREGVLNIMGVESQCAVLNDGRRVFTGPVIEEMMEELRRMK